METTESRGSVQQFLEERRYLHNLTTSTLAWYHQVFRSFNNCVTEDEFKRRIIHLREKGVSPISINSWLRGVNAYLKWKGAGFKLPKLKEPQKILATFTPQHVSALLSTKQKTLNNRRAQVLAALILDTGLRIGEALSLRRGDIDLENLTLKVMGKGRKERRVPLSVEGRRWVYLWLRHGKDYLFGTRGGTHLTIRNAERDFLNLCKGLGIEGVRCSPHTLRHTFATNYLRRGGNLYYLQRILGHSSITTTERYLRSLGVEDLRKVHDGLSLLSGGNGNGRS